ncbi:FAD:protein FMN transferase [Paenibacillus antarcticus]|uniref:FAD:protein FMN transferase n=1 Tax=Paenibacillus antarcticus TaxID=253703 RepID=UPI000A6026B1|nr:FAD:protein FMN transferase [Paenibacillus antarcticus]
MKDIIRTGHTLHTLQPLLIDVGAAGKGYLVDNISQILQGVGITDFVVDGSGDFRHSGESGIRVGLEHPFNASLVIDIANIKKRSMCASAINRRAWGDNLHHVIDARTGKPVHMGCR